MDIISLTKKIGIYNSLKDINAYIIHDLHIKNKIFKIYERGLDFTDFHLNNKYKIREEDSKKIINQIWLNAKKQSYLETFPLVSIIIINRNGLNHLKRLFKRNINYPNYEIIVWDNASNDTSVDFLEKIKKNHNLKIIKNKENSSFSKANNESVKLANGQYILFLNNDIEMEDNFLNHLMKTMLSSEDIASVGAKLAYPNCSNSKENYKKSFKIQHAGIHFKNHEYFLKPYNAANGNDLIFNNEKPIEKPALTAAVLLVDKSKFLEVGGFHEEYVYGYEDVDLCLKFLDKGYKNIYCSDAFSFHYEFGTQEKNSKKEIRKRRLNNKEIFENRWKKTLKEKYLLDKFHSDRFFSEKPLKICFAVSENNETTDKGDFFTAFELSSFLDNFGWESIFIDRKNWYDLPNDVDVLITMIDSYDLGKIRSENKSIIKIAWPRNWFNRWVENPSFRNYDIVLATSTNAVDFIYEKTGIKAHLFPIATNHNNFNPSISKKPEFTADYCFTGSYWDSERDIITFLEPKNIDYKFNLYGKNWSKINKFKEYHKGFYEYSRMPEIYASVKIVINDANIATKDFGSVNSRVFDAIASGALIISNNKLDHDFFNGNLPFYESKEDLIEKINYYLSNDKERIDLTKKLQKIVFEKHTYEKRAETLKDILENYIRKNKIAIKVPVPNWDEVEDWGDYYIAKGLKKEFEKKGFIVKIDILPDWDYEYDNMDLILVLRGLNRYKTKKNHFNIMWNISHPDKVTIDEYNDYNHVFIASDYWAKELSKKIKVPVDTLLQCSDPELFFPDYDEKYKCDLLFVGNSRNVYRKIIKDLLPTEHDLAIYGKDWEKFVNKKYIKGEHIPNNQLRKAYSSCRILLNDHWDDMREKGFISNRIFDGLACGSLIITDDVKGLSDLEYKNVLIYKSKEDLELLIEKSIKTDLTQNQIFTFEKAVEKILKRLL